MLEGSAFWQLLVSRALLYLREPEVIFWTYGFPLILVVALGLAFNSDSGPPVQTFALVEGPVADSAIDALKDNQELQVEVLPREEAMTRLRRNQILVVMEIDPQTLQVTYHYDPSNPESRPLRMAVDDALQRASGREDAFPSRDEHVTAPGSRYVDFLVPGLIGMNIMMGGMWGIGFVIVDMRVRNQMKRLLATPVRRTTFLIATLSSRVMFFLPEAAFLLAAAWLIFDIPINGSVLAIFLMALVGVLSFAGLGLLTACRAKRLETISGLINLIMMPMWIASGIFFSASRFPDFMQPFIQALPLTQLINALRAIMLEGAPLLSQTLPLAVLAAWGGISYLVALKIFRWG
ncbi:MAG TPA: ABC transporter permease [Acidobacteriota bacterium]|nr:ABC transporter permease [Acidobacteriota bacterium]